jgi:hypothetical protein
LTGAQSHLTVCGDPIEVLSSVHTNNSSTRTMICFG